LVFTFSIAELVELVLAEERPGLRVPDHLDLGVRERLGGADRLGLEVVELVDDGDLLRELGEEERLLDAELPPPMTWISLPSK